MGEIADALIDSMIFGGDFDDYGEYSPRRRRLRNNRKVTASEVAESLFDDAEATDVKKLNEGVIKF